MCFTYLTRSFLKDVLTSRNLEQLRQTKPFVMILPTIFHVICSGLLHFRWLGMDISQCECRWYCDVDEISCVIVVVVLLLKDAGKYRANRIIFDSDSDAETAASTTAAAADVIQQEKHTQSNKQVVHALKLSCSFCFNNKHNKLVPTLRSSRRHLSYGDCLDDKSKSYQNCSVLCCVQQLCTMIRTHI